jgi:TRAP-type C4-dicarboxylate transport system substrate-binding protein
MEGSMTRAWRNSPRLVAALIGAVALFAAGPSRADKITLKIASGHNASWHFVQFTQQYFMPEVVKRVKERTKHEIVWIEGFASAMVKPTEVLEGLQSGIVDVGIYCICHEGQKLALQNFPMYLPFGPTDADISVKAARKVYEAVPQLVNIYEKSWGQKLLALVPFDTYMLMSRFPIKSAADVKGKKIGGAGPNMFWVENAGAQVLTVTGPEVYTSFQSGLMDAVIGFVSIEDTLKLYDVAPYLNMTGFGAMTNTNLNISLRTYNRLPKDVRDIIVEVGRDMEARVGKFTNEVFDKYVKLVEKNGAKFVQVSDADRKGWAEMLADAPGKIAKKIEAETKLPMGKAMKAYIEATTAAGHKWPVRYKID